MFYPKSIQVHSGTFHADDVICCVQAKILNSSVKIMRTDRDLGGTNIAKRVIVADVGSGMFDHHQKDAKLREDGIKHCAASLLWGFWGRDVLRKVYSSLTDDQIELLWKQVDDGFMKTLSIIDNGITLGEPIKFDSTALSVANIVGNFNPTWLENSTNQELDNRFRRSMEIVSVLFKRYIINCADGILAKIQVEELINSAENGILVLDRYISWEEAVVNQGNINCVVYPSLRHGWNVQLAPVHLGAFETKINVPKEWKGYKIESGEKAPMNGMTFCHASGFITAFKEREQAVEAAKYLVEFNEHGGN